MAKRKFEVFGVKQIEKVSLLERRLRGADSSEVVPYARGTSYLELALNVVPDRDKTPDNPMVNRLVVVQTKHVVRIGLRALLVKIYEYVNLKKKEYPMDVLSISGGRDNEGLYAITFLRCYTKKPINFDSLYDFLGERNSEFEEEQDTTRRLNVEQLEKIEYTDEELVEHQKRKSIQEQILLQSTEEKPFLNQIDNYVLDLPEFDDTKPLMYLLEEKERRTPTVAKYDEFIKVFAEAIKYVTEIEQDSYYNALHNPSAENAFMNIVHDYLINTCVLDRKSLKAEDVPVMMEKMHKALFELYIVQDLIDDPQVTDIKITDPDCIRVRIKGKAYLSDVSFLGDEDYYRFMNMLMIRNNIDDRVPEQTFTDNHDIHNILRFTITMPYVTATEYPILHIRKIARRKMLSEDLIKAGMMDEKIRDYLLDCGRKSTGVVFAGPPGSGKTIALNWFLEDAYEDSAEILVIQENDELFSYRKGIMFQHVVNHPMRGEQACSLEDLGQLALVAGANVFVIGETKGAEICSAITLANSGCRTAMTIHSRSSTDTVDKMADLAMRGYARDYHQAKRMLKCFQTIVYLEDFQVKEISEVIGFDEEKKDMIYRPIYRKQEN